MDVNLSKAFFSNLAHRFYKENDLSDITWALSEAHPEFKRLFLSFFFSEIDDVSEITLSREVSEEDSRPDFSFEVGNSKYIIEVKKFDKDYHFEQYKKTFPGARFGWIAIYNTEKQDGIEIRTWEEFKIFLERFVETVNSNELIHSYISYIEQTCSIINFKKMTLDNSPFFFNKLIEKVIQSSLPEFDVNNYNQAKSINEWRNGKYFSLQKKGSNTVIYPWFGVYYDKEKTLIYIGFNYSCKPIHDAYNDDKLDSKGIYSEKPYFDVGGWDEICYELKDNDFKRFNTMTEPKEQEKLLSDFFMEVIKKVEPYIL